MLLTVLLIMDAIYRTGTGTVREYCLRLLVRSSVVVAANLSTVQHRIIHPPCILLGWASSWRRCGGLAGGRTANKLLTHGVQVSDQREFIAVEPSAVARAMPRSSLKLNTALHCIVHRTIVWRH